MDLHTCPDVKQAGEGKSSQAAPWQAQHVCDRVFNAQAHCIAVMLLQTLHAKRLADE